MTTNVQSSNALTVKHFNAALFLESARTHTITNMLTDGVPTLKSEESKSSGKQTSSGAPIVRIDNLAKSQGDDVNVDIFHQLNMQPVMGDDTLAGKGGSLKYASMDLKIDQGRTMVDSGGRMSRQRTMHDLQKVARSLLTPYYGRLEEQLSAVHLAGARGDYNATDWLVPLESDAKFSKICVNPVKPPTFDRHFFGGDATSVDTLDSADLFDLAAVDQMRLALDEMAYPLQAIKYEKDSVSEENPFFVLLVTPRMWNDFYTSTSAADYRTMQSRAQTRKSDFKHAVFSGDCIMWNNILIRKQKSIIRFNTGTNVAICTDSADATVSTATAATNIERGMLLGAQALANAYGNVAGKGSLPFSWNDEPTDHKNKMEHSIAWMNGKAKIRFKGTDNRVNDHGVMVLDTAVS